MMGRTVTIGQLTVGAIIWTMAEASNLVPWDTLSRAQIIATASEIGAIWFFVVGACFLSKKAGEREPA